MARSPSDATRFTATGPYIPTKTASTTSFAPDQPNAASPSHFQPSTAGGPPGETSHQRIARLRAAATAARLGKESNFDSVVRVGRVWADRAHRVTAFSLIALTVLSGLVATAGITDMLMHNRRRKQEWLQEQRRKSAVELDEARRAQGAGRASQDQLLLINQERARQEAAEAKRNRPGVFKRASNWLSGASSDVEQQGAGAAVAVAVAAATPHGDRQTLPTGSEGQGGTFRAVRETIEAHRRQGERPLETVRPLGGPLDRQAQGLVDAASDAGKGWFDWMTGR